MTNKIYSDIPSLILANPHDIKRSYLENLTWYKISVILMGHTININSHENDLFLLIKLMVCWSHEYLLFIH